MLLSAGTCYLGIATSSMKDPVVKKVHADGDSREHRVQHKDYFAEQALQMVMEHL
jgi:nicotinamide mononucleotide (NMN) deamidase PncC